MSIIYSHATSIDRWVGEGSPGVEAALRVVRNCYNFNHGNCSGGDKCDCSGTAHTLRRLDMEVKSHMRDSKSFRSFYEICELEREMSPKDFVDACGGVFNGSLSE